ncbi:TlpA family protein disulfide reductase [Aestuariibaculum sp. M13]|uniref:TlpA family protein disulfide reductase n=1 Tax=Aestuariibaculum sp. M13 TaxID=2967132 RepID=UPI002159E166|nr:TlpA disulfide reductase family protein [Aestuariibaculum sp. M13]MCR8668025.1 TlpA family protein disulfide reductase [Aestuariibaculum sp. M13]
MRTNRILMVIIVLITTSLAIAIEKRDILMQAPFVLKNKEIDTLKIGDLCPDFKMENLERKKAKLSNLRGKYVLIDVWASWCYPCRKQMPFFEELKEDFKGQDIVFLGVNLDERDFRWLGDVSNLHMKGEQWRVLNKDFEDRFGIKYIPRYILLDKKGYIIENFMTKPDKPETKVYLEKLLNIK